MRIQASRRVDSPELQGEGSYVVITSPKVREIRRVQNAPRGEDYEASLALLENHIVDWNWEDEEGKPLALPKDNPAILDELTNDEMIYLLKVLTSIDHSKN